MARAVAGRPHRALARRGARGRAGLRPRPLWSVGLCALLALAGCETLTPPPAPQTPVVAPQVRPDRVAPPPSAASAELAAYYTTVQSDLLERGLLRQDGGADIAFGPADLVRNFERIAFFDEYARGGGTPVVARAADPAGVGLSRWAGPVQIGVEFGASVDPRRAARDAGQAAGYADRLARLTGHPITAGRGNPNFHVFVTGLDDREFLARRLRQLVPSLSPAELDLMVTPPRPIYCLVVAVSGARAPQTYTRAIALIRAEHPDLLRLSCIHEEIAQGLGLANDSASARPSIFNDDDEFALLTQQDELLLRLLYDPRLPLGITAEAARPIASQLAQELTGQPL